MQGTITYRFEEGEHPTLKAVRIIVATVNMSRVGAHARMLREATEQWRTDTQQPKIATPKEETNGNVQPEGQQEEQQEGQQEGLLVSEAKQAEDNWLYSQYTRWATLAAATTTVSVIKHGKKNQTVELDEDTPDDWPWQKSSLAELGWDNPAGMGEIPVDLFTAWEARAMSVNPGIFGPPLTSTNGKKKMGLVQIL